MLQSIRILLTGLIDYAGLFPPAALEMAMAVDHYATYREGPNSWMLGRFILPVARLAEFEAAASGRVGTTQTWQVSVIAGPDLPRDLEAIAQFNARNEPRIVIDTIEIKASSPDSIPAAWQRLPPGLTAYFEIPLEDDLVPLVRTIANGSARAKVRTGSTVAEGFPSAAALARFIRICADEDVPFKATAGLHHPLRSVHDLTAQPGSDQALMHGFLNVFLAAAFAQTGMVTDRLTELLEESDLAAFHFEDDAVVWRGEMVVKGHLRNLRSLFAISFGSCSFEEPLDDLGKLGLM
jgi:hypothetical protein